MLLNSWAAAWGWAWRQALPVTLLTPSPAVMRCAAERSLSSAGSVYRRPVVAYSLATDAASAALEGIAGSDCVRSDPCRCTAPCSAMRRSGSLRLNESALHLTEWADSRIHRRRSCRCRSEGRGEPGPNADELCAWTLGTPPSRALSMVATVTSTCLASQARVRAPRLREDALRDLARVPPRGKLTSSLQPPCFATQAIQVIARMTTATRMTSGQGGGIPLARKAAATAPFAGKIKYCNCRAGDAG